ncbi:fimbrial biogenesis chaperone [Morganella morganii]|uniref:fimbrial biogenesis chaperone n=1 Tax=Morganella morganii TaxID=582 RepID=UPI00236749F0|nr:molecular chaperone [Morganella morganii]
MFRNIAVFFIFVLNIISFTAGADGISLSKSRIIFNAGSKSQTVVLYNDSKSPFLVQASVGESPEGKASDKFIVTPPLFRINAGAEYTVRIMPNDFSSLPADRESMFFFKARAIPPASSSKNDDNKADLVFITSIVIKLHYRPELLAELDNAIFRRINMTEKNNKWYLENPTPYYLTVIDLTINGETQSGSIILPPEDKILIRSNQPVRTAEWRIINDYGGTTDKFSFPGAL